LRRGPESAKPHDRGSVRRAFDPGVEGATRPAVDNTNFGYCNISTFHINGNGLEIALSAPRRHPSTT